MAWRQTVNKQPAKPPVPKPKFETKDDDWDTDVTYQNAATEKSQRYGSASVPGSGRVDHVDFNSIQEKMKTVDQTVKEDFKEKHPTRGYGGKYGTEQVMDKAAEGFSYKADVKKHSSQTDGKKGFGGEHGIDEHAKDPSAVGFDYKPTLEKHSSQTDSSKGFGGTHGTDQNAQGKSAVPLPQKKPVPLPSSQTSAKQDVEKEEPSVPTPAPTVASPPQPSPKPKVAEKPAPSTSSKPAVGNIRGRFENIQKDQEAETAKRVAEKEEPGVPTPAPTVASPPQPPPKPKVAEKPAPSTSSKPAVGNIRARFENIQKDQEAETAKRVAEERKKRATTEEQLQQKEQPKNNDQEEIKQQDTPLATQETTRTPSPPRPKIPPIPPARSKASPQPPPPEVATKHIYENFDKINVETANLDENDDDNNAKTDTSTESTLENVETVTSTTNEEDKDEPVTVVGGVNVASILRHRKTSSSSAKDGDDELAANKEETNPE